MMKIFCAVFLFVVVCAEPPVPEGFAGYERGGYEISTRDQKTFPGADQLNFPGVSDVTGGSRSGGGSPGSGGRPGGLGEAGSQEEFLGGERDGGERSGQQRGRGRFEGGGRGEDREDEGEEGSLDDIPGVAGKDYPIYGEIPTTSFSCEQQTASGYYADVDTQCQVFHICQKGGQKNSVLCPNGTIFNQKVLVCSWWYDFDCDSAPGLFAVNELNNAEADAATGSGGRGVGGEFGDNNRSPNSIASGGYPENNQNFEQGDEEFSANGFNGASSVSGQNSFDGYQENGPRPAKLSNYPEGNQNTLESGDQTLISGVSNGESQSGHDSRSSGRFSKIGENRGNNNAEFNGYSDNGPNAGIRNDLTTSDGRNGVDVSSSGRGGHSEAGAEYPRGGRNGNTRGRNGNGNAPSQGLASQYESSSDNSESLQLGAIRDQGTDNGYSDVTGSRGSLEQLANEYLPPGGGATGSQNPAGRFSNDPSNTYLPPS